MRSPRVLFPLLLAASGGAAVASDKEQYLQMPNDLYPPAALAAHMEGDVRLRLIALPDGSAQCSPTGPSSIAILKTATCDLLVKRITFRPNPAPTASLRIVAQWRIWKPIAGEQPSPDRYGGAIPVSPEGWVTIGDYPSGELGNSGATSVVFDIGTDGRASGCKVVKSSGATALDEKTCKIIDERARFIPAIDDTNRPRPTIGHFKLTWQSGG